MQPVHLPDSLKSTLPEQQRGLIVVNVEPMGLLIRLCADRDVLLSLDGTPVSQVMCKRCWSGVGTRSAQVMRGGALTEVEILVGAVRRGE